MSDEQKKDGLALLREPFPAHQISKLPKGGVMLDYVGHAALTDRLLDADQYWSWEPLAFAPNGLPLFDETGGLWIRLTVRGVTRLGYGHAAKKGDPGAREKEVIGDALRNAAMRFGAALDLWHKGQLHIDESEEAETPAVVAKAPDLYEEWLIDMQSISGEGVDALKAAWDRSKIEYRKWLVETDRAKWDAMKKRAAQVSA